jgi:hypothetical protein
MPIHFSKKNLPGFFIPENRPVFKKEKVGAEKIWDTMEVKI